MPRKRDGFVPLGDRQRGLPGTLPPARDGSTFRRTPAKVRWGKCGGICDRNTRDKDRDILQTWAGPMAGVPISVLSQCGCP